MGLQKEKKKYIDIISNGESRVTGKKQNKHCMAASVTFNVTSLRNSPIYEKLGR